MRSSIIILAFALIVASAFALPKPLKDKPTRRQRTVTSTSSEPDQPSTFEPEIATSYPSTDEPTRYPSSNTPGTFEPGTTPSYPSTEEPTAAKRKRSVRYLSINQQRTFEPDTATSYPSTDETTGYPSSNTPGTETSYHSTDEPTATRPGSTTWEYWTSESNTRTWAPWSTDSHFTTSASPASPEVCELCEAICRDSDGRWNNVCRLCYFKWNCY